MGWDGRKDGWGFMGRGVSGHEALLQYVTDRIWDNDSQKFIMAQRGHLSILDFLES